MEPTTSSEAAHDLMARAKALGVSSAREGHCCCAALSHKASGVSGNCTCLDKCPGDCAHAPPQTACELFEAALVISGGTYAAAYTALGRHLVAVGKEVDTTSWPEAAARALSVVREKCRGQKIQVKRVNGTQLFLAALVVDPLCAPAFDVAAETSE